MKRIIALLMVFPLTGIFLTGCATRYGTHNPESKHALYTLAGGTVGALTGALFAASAGGAIVGALVADIYSVATIKYQDRRLEDREEAARRYKDRLKAEEKRKEEKKVEEQKERGKEAEKNREEDKKAEEQKEPNKKAEEKREENKKVEEKKEQNEKAERKAEDKKVKLFIEESSVVTPNVRTGSMVEANVQYTLLAPVDDKNINITETRILSSSEKRMELDRREVVRQQGTHLSTVKFTMPDDMPKGYCVLFTTISVGRYSKTAKSVINII
jgi:flagellar biosynthesis GTPase FlhF